jgi:hypothetical protein
MRNLKPGTIEDIKKVMGYSDDPGRCRDCQHYAIHGELGQGRCAINIFYITVSSNGNCAHGTFCK